MTQETELPALPELRERHKEFADWYLKFGAAETVEDVAWLAWKAAVLAERERAAAVAARWGETHADGETVNARNAGSKIARAIRTPPAKEPT